MKPDKTVFVKVVGEQTGETFEGKFLVKGSLVRRDSFRADAIRRDLLGPSPENTPPAPSLQSEAYVTGQVAVRVLKGPKWWDESNLGQELEDSNVIMGIYEAILESDDKETKELVETSKKAADKLKKMDEEEELDEKYTKEQEDL